MPRGSLVRIGISISPHLVVTPPSAGLGNAVRGRTLLHASPVRVASLPFCSDHSMLAFEPYAAILATVVTNARVAYVAARAPHRGQAQNGPTQYFRMAHRVGSDGMSGVQESPLVGRIGVVYLGQSVPVDAVAF